MQVQRRIDTREAAIYTGLSYSKLTKLRTYGGGPKYLKIGERVIYAVSDIDSWLERHVRQNTSQPQAKLRG